MISFIVGSQNPVKIQAVREGATALLGEITVTSIDVPSGVRAQPIGDDEMIAGATNRANAALHTHGTAMFGVGLEGGVTDRAEGLFASAWCALVHRDGRVGLASTGHFMLPPKVAELVRGGMELGHADDLVHGRTNSKQSTGSIGILTHGALVRAQFYAPAVMMALIRFVNEDLFEA
jgi:inosine/xanthosine triphosphatase